MDLSSGLAIASMGTGGEIDSALGVATNHELVFVADVSAYSVHAYEIATSTRASFRIDQDTIRDAQSTCTRKTVAPSKGFQGPSCFNPHGLAWHDGRLYVADPDNAAVYIFDSLGRHVETLRGAFAVPRGLAITPSGRLLIAERTRVLMLSLDGKLLRALDVPGAVNMLGIAADLSRAFVADVQANAVFVLSLLKPNHTKGERLYKRYVER